MLSFIFCLLINPLRTPVLPLRVVDYTFMHTADNTKVWDYRAWSKKNRGIPILHRRQLFIVPRLWSRLIATRSTPTTPDKRPSPPWSPDAGSTQGEKRKRDSQKLEQLQQTIRNNKVVRRNLEMKNRALAICAVFASSHSPSVPRGSGISPQCDNAKQGYLHSLDGVQRATATKRISFTLTLNLDPNP